MTGVQCPRCGNAAESLQQLDAGTAAQLSERNGEQVPEQICMTCYRQLVGSLGTPGAAGSALMAQERAKEQRKIVLWKSRVALIKKARMMMGEKAFSDAAVAYEKYLRVLEVVFDCPQGGLNPEHFKDSARTQELTVVASVYWDLLRIYDTSERYGERQALAANKLAQFLRFTPIYPDIIRKAESFSRSAKNPNAVKAFLKSATESKGKCFIASAAFEYEEAPEVQLLRRFREEKLRPTVSGVCVIFVYEKISPTLAFALNRCAFVKPIVRLLFRPLLLIAKRSLS